MKDESVCACMYVCERALHQFIDELPKVSTRSGEDKQRRRQMWKRVYVLEERSEAASMSRNNRAMAA